MHDFYEFFSGGGMARLGLGSHWRCLMANDFDKKKVEAYRRHFGPDHVRFDDVQNLATSDLPGRATLAWASFPCQDLSLAGMGQGLKGHRSGTFWPFWMLMEGLKDEGRAPKLIVLENVCGAITSNRGRDFRSICEAVVKLNYRIGAMIVDAVHFVPQSRPRLFLVAVADGAQVPIEVTGQIPNPIWHSKRLVSAVDSLPSNVKAKWIWWQMPEPPRRNQIFAQLIEKNPVGVAWHSPKDTNSLLKMMAPIHKRKVSQAKKLGGLRVGALYRRTRDGVQRAEVRFDDIAGCLRTPRGGSSRQTVLVVADGNPRSRLLSPREAARLMGLPEDYELPESYNDAYHLIGDGLVVPVVSYLSQHVLTPIAEMNRLDVANAA